jgi:hypothetical protein
LVQLDVWELGSVTEEARKLVWLEVWECSRSGSLRGSKTGSTGGLQEQVRILVRFETWFGKRPGSDPGEVRNLVRQENRSGSCRGLGEQYQIMVRFTHWLTRSVRAGPEHGQVRKLGLRSGIRFGRRSVEP